MKYTVIKIKPINMLMYVFENIVSLFKLILNATEY